MNPTTSQPVGATPQIVVSKGEELLEEQIARYGSPEFRAALIRHFHEAKRLAINAAQAAGSELNRTNDDS